MNLPGGGVMGLPMEGKCSACNNWPISPPVVIRNGVLCVDCASDYLRWREWPKEIPEIHGLYLTVDCADGLKNLWFDGGWPWPNVTYWRPIGPLPGEGGE